MFWETGAAVTLRVGAGPVLFFFAAIFSARVTPIQTPPGQFVHLLAVWVWNLGLILPFVSSEKAAVSVPRTSIRHSSSQFVFNRPDLQFLLSPSPTPPGSECH